MTEPNFKELYFKVVGKVYRSGMYYRMVAARHRQRAATMDSVAEQAASLAVADSTARVAYDMDFIVAKAFGYLTEAERQQIRDANPTPFTCLNKAA